MLRVNLNTKDFENRTFDKSELVKTYKNGSKDYRIIKETEKAYLLGRVDNLTSRNCEITFWVPKKAITFKGDK